MKDYSLQPLVSVVTPIYNGECFLRECIESVLAQTYGNWQYVIVNNCSTDRTLEIAQEYAAKDSRIQVHSNDRFLNLMQNHNRALSLASPASKYCKPLMADDYLFPECLATMVQLAEGHPSIGMVCASAYDGARTIYDGGPDLPSVISGKEASRSELLGRPYLLGTPTTVLLRTDLVSSRSPFYDESLLHCDFESCIYVLQKGDLGYVRQPMSFVRTHEESMSATFSFKYNTHLLETLTILKRYGPALMTPGEMQSRVDFLMFRYYRFLLKNLVCLRGRDFFAYHLNWLRTSGHPLRPLQFVHAGAYMTGYALTHPERVLVRLRSGWKRLRKYITALVTKPAVVSKKASVE